MILQNDDVALAVLRKYDCHCQEVLDYCNKVKLYNYDKKLNNWIIKDDSEGAFYLVKRNTQPIYQFVILGKCNKPGSQPGTTEIPLSQYLISQVHETFYMIKSENGIIQAILFPTKLDCDRFCLKVDRIVMELKNLPEKLSSLTVSNLKPKFIESIEGKLTINKNDKLVNMLESARQRYEQDNNHIEKYSRPIDIKELFKSTSANHNPSTSVMVDSVMSPSYTLQPIQPIQQQQQQGFSIRLLKDKDSQTNQNKSFVPLIPPVVLNFSDKVVQSPLSSKNGPNTLTVTELEKYLVQNASSSSDQKNNQEVENDDDDFQLYSPNKFEETNSCLNKEQFKEALIFLLQNDQDGRFIGELHSAYLQSVQQQRSTARK